MSGTGHYENFPVASWLCPPHLRPPVLALYRYARTADDLADEGDALPEIRLAALGRYRQALDRSLAGEPAHPEAWPDVFTPLARQALAHRLPGEHLHALLNAFEQDVRNTALQIHPANDDALLAYCAESANPVGRLLLHLYGVTAPPALVLSDHICSALQLINFWQDLGQDLRRNRHYLPDNRLAQHGLERSILQRWAQGQPPEPDLEPAAQALVAGLCENARRLMWAGAPLVHQVPGRLGWELRLVVQGGLHILDRIAAVGHRSWTHRPRLRASDGPRLLWRAATMGWRASPANLS